MKKKDILKVIAYIRVYGLDLYGTKHTNLDTGKGNLELYFCSKLNWSESRLKKIVSLLLSEGILNKKPAEPGFKFYALSSICKTQLKFIEI